jgi:5-(carboxyamino)imidazole ribonucleotide synthase
VSGGRGSQAVAEVTPPVPPAPAVRVAMVGAGQLARMTHQAAIDYGIELHVLAGSPADPAVTAGAGYTLGRSDDAALLRRLAAGADVLTFDHELVPLDVLRAMASEGCVIRPHAEALTLGCDKMFARTAVSGIGALSIQVPAFAPVMASADVAAFAERHGWPVVLKARRGGYDGRGVVVADDMAAADRVLAAVPDGDGPHWVVEEHLDIVAEFAILIARSPSGFTATYPPIGTLQVDGICRELTIPADLPEEIVQQGTSWARSILEGFDATGIGAVEYFVTRDGRLVLNEFALRPHNSGHITIESCATSQFHQHLRAVLDWPLGETGLLRPAATVNLIADATTTDFPSRLPQALAVPDVHVHLYQKAPRPGRKVGHVTALADSTAEAMERARAAAERFF